MTMRRALMALPVGLLCAGILAEEGRDTDWSSLKLTLRDLKTWGARHYTYSAREPGGKEVSLSGKVTLTTELKEDAVVLRDSFQVTYKGEKISLDMVHTCRKDAFLSPTRIESEGKGDGEAVTFAATVADGRAEVRRADGRVTTREVPHGTITMAAMMRLVTLVPRTPGKSYSYDYSLESDEMNLKKGYRLSVLEPEEITIGDRKVKCSKLELTGGGIRPAYYWVSEDGVLQRILLDDRKVIELSGAS